MVDKYGYNTKKISIPKTIHIIWIGNQSKRPNHFINSWIEKNPSWRVKLWENNIFANHPWHNVKHMETLLEYRKFHGISDMMRYEILFLEGGLYVDADSYCVRPLEDWLFDSDICLGWENEHTRPNLIGNNVMATVPQHPFLAKLIETIYNRPTILGIPLWQLTGPQLVTEIHRENLQYNYTLWPSHYFTPLHHTGAFYKGKGHVFAEHIWGFTKGQNDNLQQITI
ncbi:glycosyltransferase family 32 protein [Zymomonas mobilis]|uniref:Uncharacterized protein n=1 Tax=Zymomonas mobilis subsp. pomaceae (strain ATCC 29192 / DSM 22645 / JCM 10191 / CCUG 17912 / NBRC 13757 / NCIMB 11200 / NRRL B-4491 / Barker I) TaxID=579138 RepID=F8ET29_ZYMMT|nr:glycosyltransferase [Zymomonas mobilis]AEI37933.1 conserved hypothetical protein [Zymomonas mobilis subsp. pomaceae ATCC 29192]MDX5949302.1 glycosyltransferase [Zymomonas mobilis subsp. pomaceae]GEB89691.1 mannosyl phosphorylinositol ceramide synthase SUR1 [Zymomonas mobilis subsp. pomaceae]